MVDRFWFGRASFKETTACGDLESDISALNPKRAQDHPCADLLGVLPRAVKAGHVQVLGFRVWGLGLCVEGSGFGV